MTVREAGAKARVLRSTTGNTRGADTLKTAEWIVCSGEHLRSATAGSRREQSRGGPRSGVREEVISKSSRLAVVRERTAAECYNSREATQWRDLSSERPHFGMIKLQRATGGCLGARSRRRARRTAKCPGEQRACLDPGVPECGNAPTVMGGDPLWKGTEGTETS